jgi:hypothetical protein
VQRRLSVPPTLATEIAMPPEGTVTIAENPEDLRAKVNAQTVEGKPTFFRLEA